MRTKEWKKRMEEKDGEGDWEGEVLLSAESNGTQRAGEDTIKVWS